MTVVGRAVVFLSACVILVCVVAGATVPSASADEAAGAHHRRHARHRHVRHVIADERVDRVDGGTIISGPLAAGLIGFGISGATAADGYGYGGYQRRQDYPAGYGYYGSGYHGPSYSYTGY